LFIGIAVYIVNLYTNKHNNKGWAKKSEGSHMLEKLRENPRAVVATLITVGVVALFVGGGSNDDAADTTQTEEAAVTQTVENEAEQEATGSEDVVIGSEPQAGPVAVEKEDAVYGAVVREGDNQTVVVRQIVNDYLSDQSQSLSAEQRLFVETVVVDSLPRNDVIFAGDKIEVDESVIAQTVADSGELTQEQIAAWAAYL